MAGTIGIPMLGWIDVVNVTLGNRGLNVEAARHCAHASKEWRALVHAYVTDWVSRGHICLALCCFEPPSRALVVITWRGM